MSAKHRDPEYLANARIIRSGVRSKRLAGVSVRCWRCGYEIDPEQTYDVGHIDPDGGPGLGNLAPEHRYKTARCIGNRSAGGKHGAALRKRRQGPAAVVTSDLLGW